MLGSQSLLADQSSGALVDDLSEIFQNRIVGEACKEISDRLEFGSAPGIWRSRLNLCRFSELISDVELKLGVFEQDACQ